MVTKKRQSKLSGLKTKKVSRNLLKTVKGGKSKRRTNSKNKKNKKNKRTIKNYGKKSSRQGLKKKQYGGMELTDEAKKKLSEPYENLFVTIEKKIFVSNYVVDSNVLDTICNQYINHLLENVINYDNNQKDKKDIPNEIKYLTSYVLDKILEIKENNLKIEDPESSSPRPKVIPFKFVEHGLEKLLAKIQHHHNYENNKDKTLAIYKALLSWIDTNKSKSSLTDEIARLQEYQSGIEEEIGYLEVKSDTTKE